MIAYRFSPKSLGFDAVATITLITICSPDWSAQGVTLIVSRHARSLQPGMGRSSISQRQAR